VDFEKLQMKSQEGNATPESLPLDCVEPEIANPVGIKG
jgi:hypothetical protein